MVNPNATVLLTTLLLVVAVVGIVATAEQTEQKKGLKIDKVLNMLETYTFAPEDDALRSGLTVEDLKEAYQEYKMFNPSNIDRIKASSPTAKLLVDFLLMPLDSKYAAQLFDRQGPEAEAAQVHFILMLEQVYKFFRPAYYGKKVSTFHHKVPKTELLLASLMDKPDGKPLSDKMIMDSYKELKMSELKFEEIVAEEDVYANLKELEYLVNDCYGGPRTILYKVIFPYYLSKIWSGSDEMNFDEIKQLFLASLETRKASVPSQTADLPSN